MKILKASALAFLFSLIFVQVQANPTSLNPTEKLEKQISKMVNDADLWGDVQESTVFKVSFTINSRGEIIVLSTDNESFDLITKSLLNYKKVEVDAQFYNKTFILPIRLNKTVS